MILYTCDDIIIIIYNYNIMPIKSKIQGITNVLIKIQILCQIYPIRSALEDTATHKFEATNSLKKEE